LIMAGKYGGLRPARQGQTASPAESRYSPGALFPAILALLLLTGQPGPLPPDPDPHPEPGPLRRNALSATAALVPGLLIHGSGHFVAGDRRTAGRLLAAQGAGLGAMVAGLLGLAAAGASRHFVSPPILLAVAGGGLFTTSALADLYGVLAPPGGAGAAPAALPGLEAGGGVLFVRNPVIRYRWLGATLLDLRLGRWQLAPRLYGSHDARTLRAEARLGRRLGRFIDLWAGLVHHREGQDVIPFDTTTAEVTVDGRSPLDPVAPSLAGSFLDWSAGLALGGSHYGGGIGAVEPTEVLLARFGFGFYLGPPSAPRGEIRFGYDHRHDDFAGGLKIPGLGSGPVGHVEAHAGVHLGPRWGLRAVVQAGSAHVLGLSLVHRQAAAR
jgi:hypothetical protein